MVRVKILTPNAGKDAEKLDYSDTVDEYVKYAASLGNSLAGSCGAKRGISVWVSNYTLGCLPQRNGNMFVENLNTNVHRNLVCTRQRLVSTRASFNGWLAKQMGYVLQQSVTVKHQNIYTSSREPAMGTCNSVACWRIMLSEKSQPQWVAMNLLV